MVKKKKKLWCQIQKIHGAKTTMFGKTFKISIDGVEQQLTVSAGCLNDVALAAFAAGKSLPKNAKARVDRGNVCCSNQTCENSLY